jgi:hypothetical protein
MSIVKLLIRIVRYSLSISLTVVTFSEAVSSSAVAAPECSAVFGVPGKSNHISEIERLQAEWKTSNFSDPKQHNPKSFRYIVHALHGQIPNLMDALNLIEGPWGFTDRLLSASIISDAHTKTFFDHGFILQIPEKIIVGSAEHDLLSANDHISGMTTQDRKLNLLRRYGLQTPAQVLQNSTSDFHNEIVIFLEGFGQRQPSDLEEEIPHPRVVGVFATSATTESKKIDLMKFANKIGEPFLDFQ